MVTLFSRVDVLFPVWFTVKNHTQVLVYTWVCFTFDVDWFGTCLIFPEVNTHLFSFRNIKIQVIFITPIHKIFNLLVLYSASSSLLICLTSSVSFTNFTEGHDSFVLLRSAVYSENRKGAKTMPWGAPVFVQITDDTTSFSRTYFSLLVR